MDALETRVSLHQCIDGLISQFLYLDQSDSSKLGQIVRELFDARVSQVRAIGQIDVSKAGARLGQVLDSLVGDSIREDWSAIAATLCPPANQTHRSTRPRCR